MKYKIPGVKVWKPKRAVQFPRSSTVSNDFYDSSEKQQKTPEEHEYCLSKSCERKQAQCRTLQKCQERASGSRRRRRAKPLLSSREGNRSSGGALFATCFSSGRALFLLAPPLSRSLFLEELQRGLYLRDYCRPMQIAFICISLLRAARERERERARCPLDKLCHKESGSWLGVYCFTTAAPKAILRKAACTQRSSLVECAVAAFIIALYNCVTAAWAPASYLFHLTISREQQLTASNYPLSSRPATPRPALPAVKLLHFVLRACFCVAAQFSCVLAGVRCVHDKCKNENLWSLMTTIQMHFTCCCALFFHII